MYLSESVAVTPLKDVTELEKEFNERLEQDRQLFTELIDSIDFSLNINPLSLPVSIWGNTYWEFMDGHQRDRILSSLFRFSLERGMKTMPLYRRSQNYASVRPEQFNSLNDLCSLPVLLKDGDASAGV
ncbi:hypothetical protein HY497_01505, partial [Candidatus Woesearchaeota archaeon]|nr:hypothetical protein [Candidatus Woesearchaeota archaeon]